MLLGRRGLAGKILWGATALFAFCPECAFAAQQTATWLGGGGSWTDSTKWSGGVVPSNNATDTYNVNIDSGNALASNVSLTTAGAFSVDALTVDTGDFLLIRNGTFSSPSTFSMSGALNVNGTLSALSYSTVNLSPNSTISGTGTLQSG
jgi:hypothetical protein